MNGYVVRGDVNVVASMLLSRSIRDGDSIVNYFSPM